MLQEVLNWLILPIDAGRPHLIDGLTSWHARLMVLSWSVMIPTGILIARFCKIAPKQKWPEELDNRTWWYLHLGIQGSASVIALVGLVLIIYKLGSISIVSSPHHALGWLTIALLIVQLLAGMFRGTKGGPTYPAANGSWRGDHYDMTLRRRVFEYTHKSAGYVALLCSVVAVLLGLWDVNAPIWMWLCLILWWLLLITTACVLQRQKRTIDTYQAIWGIDPELPGNKLKSIGLWVHKR